MRFSVLLALVGVVSAGWTVERRGIATIALSVSCADTQTCYIGGVQNGPGNVVFKTTNNGQSWEQQYLDPEGVQLMFLTTTALDARRALIAGFGFGTNAQHTSDGENFRNAGPTGLPAVSYSSTVIQGVPNTYVLPGYFTDGNHAAVAVSRDAGATFEVFPTGRPALETTRFASFPSNNVWFIAGGQQPRPDHEAEGVHWLTEHVKIETKGNHSKAVKISYNMDPVTGQPAAYRDMAEYVAVVSRSRDGGRTFERVFYEEEAGYYLNYIDCPTESLCFVVGEGPAGARVLRTRNAGNTWEVVWRAVGRYDIMGLEFITDQEGWACGMKHAPSLVAIFLHTTNGGQTWTEVEGPAAMLCFSLTFPNARQGKATAIEVYGGISTVLAYTA